MKYRALFNAEPTQFAFQGYDIASYFISQCSRQGGKWMKKIDENEYYLHAKEYVAHLKQKDNILEITSNYEDKSFWTNYFDLNTDYSKIKKELSKNENLLPAINYGYGIHILRQDFSEMLISFIMSQNKQIPQIKQCVELYCQKFGEKIVKNLTKMYIA